MNNNYAAEKPSPAAMQRALASVTKDLRPVKSLSSNGVLTAGAMLLFIAFSAAIACTLGLAGFHQLSAAQCCLYYATVLACAAVLSAAVVFQMIPGSRRSVGVATALAFPFAATAICAIAIFPHAGSNHFVASGYPCLRAGLLCAIGSGLLASVFLRHGYFGTPAQAYPIAGTLAGFTGIAVLALHCPQQNWLHVLVWHLGAPLLSALAALLGWRLRIIFPSAVTYALKLRK